MSSEKVLDLNDVNFDENTQSGVALIDFWAPWCGPCRMQGPIVERVAEQIGSSAKVIKVDVDQAPATATKFGIQSIPTVLVMKDGQLQDRLVGVQPEAVLLSALNRAVNS